MFYIRKTLTVIINVWFVLLLIMLTLYIAVSFWFVVDLKLNKDPEGIMHPHINNWFYLQWVLYFILLLFSGYIIGNTLKVYVIKPLIKLIRKKYKKKGRWHE